jgi:hypothetical protein
MRYCKALEQDFYANNTWKFLRMLLSCALLLLVFRLFDEADISSIVKADIFGIAAYIVHGLHLV